VTTWWDGLSTLNRFLWASAILTTTAFMQQLLGALGRLLMAYGGGVDLDAAPNRPGEGDAHTDADAWTECQPETSSFRVLSTHSLLAFAALFSWAAAWYLAQGMGPVRALLRGCPWGLGGLLTTDALLWFLPRMGQPATVDPSLTVGKTATVDVDIPRNASGRVRLVLPGRVVHLPAQCSGQKGIAAGAHVRILRVIAGCTVEVEEAS